MEDHLTISATIALLVWPIATVLIFLSIKPISRAVIWSMLGAQLLLPVGASIKFSMVPPIEKATIASFSTLACCMFFAVWKKRHARSSTMGLVEILLLLNIVCPLITSELNPDHIIVGDRFLPGVGLYDAVSAVENTIIALIPFMLGRRFLSAKTEAYDILVALSIAGLLYSVPLLFEIRFSPQLHYWVYGYYPTDFVQAVREGGFRPMVFMGHGLLAAFFLMTSASAAATLWRNGARIGPLPLIGIAIYLQVVVLLCKSLASLIYSGLGTLLIVFARPKAQVRLAVALILISLSYPLLRSSDLFPTTFAISTAALIDVDRAGSLKFRFDNEDKLLSRALERSWFGWGRFGRSRVYNEDTGKDESITDGRWIIDIGQFGLIGFLAEFGLLSVCVLRAAKAYRLLRSETEQRALATLILLVSLNIFDLLPNSGLIPWLWLLAGSLLGQAETLSLSQKTFKTSVPTSNS